MQNLCTIQYFLRNDPFGNINYYKDEETAKQAFQKMKSNGNYRIVILFDKNGKKIDEIIRK